MIRILLVDDQSLIRQGLRAMLSLESDLEIVGMAENGEEAIAQVESLQPDILLMDMRMPVMNGVRATSIICEKFPNTKVLILSTYDDECDVGEAIRAGAKGYVLKSISLEELVNAIHSICRGYSLIKSGIVERLANSKKVKPNLDKSTPSLSDSLTPRELDVARLVAVGATNQEIADRLFISKSTVKTHINSIFNRLSLKNRSQLAIYASSASISDVAVNI